MNAGYRLQKVKFQNTTMLSVAIESYPKRNKFFVFAAVLISIHFETFASVYQINLNIPFKLEQMH